MKLKELFDKAQFILVWEDYSGGPEPNFMAELWKVVSKVPSDHFISFDTEDSCYRFSNDAEVIPVKQGICKVKNEDYYPDSDYPEAEYFYLVFLTTIQYETARSLNNTISKFGTTKGGAD